MSNKNSPPVLRHPLTALLSLAFLALASGLFACAAGSVTTTAGSGTRDPFGNVSATEPAPEEDDGGSEGGKTGNVQGGGGGGSALGPSCTAYVACCEEVAAMSPQLAASCDSVKSQIEMAQANGVSTSTYEASCKSGINSFKSAGYCN